MTHLERLFAALYVSEGWYALSEARHCLKRGMRPLYYQTRAVVLYDRVLNDRASPALTASED